MSMTISTDNSISIDGQATGLRVTQNREGTVVYSVGAGGANYREHKMPSVRYSTAHDSPKPRHQSPEMAAKYPAPAGRAQFEADIRALLLTL